MIIGVPNEKAIAEYDQQLTSLLTRISGFVDNAVVLPGTTL
jgi:hypothetical protein